MRERDKLSRHISDFISVIFFKISAYIWTSKYTKDSWEAGKSKRGNDRDGDLMYLIPLNLNPLIYLILL